MISTTKVSFFLAGSLVALVILAFAYHLKSDRDFISMDESQCYYENFKGTCRIISVIGVSSSAGRVAGSDYELGFEFIPEGSIYDNNDRSNVESLVVTSSLVNRFDVRKEDTFRCTMRKNVYGSCPPVVFEFLWSEKINE